MNRGEPPKLLTRFGLSAKIVPQIKITNIKARYLGFSGIFDVIWVDFLAIRSIITPKAF
jgi:hypothetical protein